MNKFWIVALESYKRNVKSVSFIVMLLAPLLFVLLVGGISFATVKLASTDEIAVVSSNEAVREAFVTQTEMDVNKKVKTEEQAKKALEKENIEGYLLIRLADNKGEVSGEYFGKGALGTTDQMNMTQLLTGLQLNMNAQRMQLSSEDLKELSKPVVVKEKQVEFKNGKMIKKKDNRQVMTLVATFVSIFIFVIIAFYSSVTASEVASEKGTRIMEIILSSTSAAKHFYGKVMGIFLVILTQMTVYLATGVIAYFGVKNMSFMKELLQVVSMKEIIRGLVGYNLLYLIFGVLIFTILAAFCGSLVSKAEDSSKAVTPVTYLSMVGYFISLTVGMASPSNIVMKVTSFVPFISSFTMPQRIASGTVSDIEVAISLLILVVATALLLKVSAYMYRSTALVYSDDGMWKTLKKSITMMKNEKAL